MEPVSASSCSICGQPLNAKGMCVACLLRAGMDENDETTPPQHGPVFDDFEIVRRDDGSLWELGRGAMGVTYRATEKSLHRSVALKVIESHNSEAVRERFLREARAAAALHHPNVAGVFRFGVLENGDRCYCAMELVEGETLEALVRRNGPLKLETALEIAIQVSRALIAAADRNLVHRDLKPGNIMLRPSGNSPGKIEVKVIDFGLAKAAAVAGEMELTRGEFVGTPAFASPEQFAGGAIDARTDIYALGVTLWFALTGRLPFAGRTIEEIRERQKEEKLPLEQLKGVPRCVVDLLRSCLAVDRKERPVSARALIKELESCQKKSQARRRHRKLALTAVAALLIVGVAAFLFSRNKRPRALVIVPEKSIAVLPFENRSGDLENAFFTDGVQDEILTDLARIADLKVISRTSVMQYKNAGQRNLRQIASDLGVANVLEGSVQRSGKRVRVNAQLIDARTDSHLWGQTYDRDLADVFAIQSEIAKAIADQLQARLSPNEKSEIEQPPTTDVTAFDFYSHAKNLFLSASGSSTGKADLLQAADLLNQAVARDPGFFEAYCLLAFTHVSLYFLDFDHTPPRLAAAQAAVQSAARLRPDAGETHLARARNLYWGYNDYDGALTELEIARRRLPSDNWVFSLKGYIERRQGRWEDSLRDLERAVALDPRNIQTLQQTARSYSLLHRYAESKALLAHVLSFEPNDAVTKVLHAWVELDANANPQPVREVIDSIRRTNPAAITNVANNWLICSLAERNVAAAEQALAACGENPILLGTNENVIFPRAFVEGVIARLKHDEENARAGFAAARVEQEKVVQARPKFGPALAVLGLIDACFGRKEDAMREGREALELARAEKDVVLGPITAKYLAMIAAQVGDADLACNQLAILVREPSNVTYGQLKMIPFWDPIRDDPRFNEILASVAPKSH
jgi:TolB-like protein/Tfp pilus assembly protein PilF